MGKDRAILDYSLSHLDKTLDFIDGFMLGDGSISKAYPHITWSLRYREFSQYIEKHLADYAPYSKNVFVEDARCKNGGYNTTYGMTRSHPDLKSQRIRWYPNGTKIVPNDVALSPTSIMIWYLSDGQLFRYGASFCTDGFAEQYVDLLVSRLNRLGIPCTKREKSKKFRVIIPSKGVKYLFDYIGEESPVECYKHKFPDTYALRDRGFAVQDRNMSNI